MRGNGTRMSVREAIGVMIVLLAWAPLASAQANAPLKLEQTIPLPDVQGRIDHLSLDVAGQRLFVSALGNDTVEVVDLKAGKRPHPTSWLKEPPASPSIPHNTRPLSPPANT